MQRKTPTPVPVTGGAGDGDDMKYAMMETKITIGAYLDVHYVIPYMMF